MTGSEIRTKFLEFFQSKQHYILPSHSLVPHEDPTLLWINCGMAPLKDYYAKKRIPPAPRMANSQKSLRTKDIENVGKTSRHHTMFEMLGNFSIGDYFKEEAIAWAWEFLAEVLDIDTDKLYVTIHPDDDEAYVIWSQVIGLPPEKIFRDDDNFWEIGPGPCGPNSEIFYDRGEQHSCGSDECTVGCDCDRYLEIWNLVFTQYNLEEDGSLTNLPYQNIDTGMSLERLASVIQGVESNYETDLFEPLIQEAIQLAGVAYNASEEATMAYRVVVDHVRAVAFAIADGAMPSNEGRGYVIRRLLRRAVRYGRKLGLTKPFLHTLVAKVVEIMKDHYTYLVDKQELVERIILIEERKFLETLDDGMELLFTLMSNLKAENMSTIPGDEAFKLYDTYGFPLDLTVDMAQEEGFNVDVEGFEQAMLLQQQRARQARKDAAGNVVESSLFAEINGGDVFVGYDNHSCASQIIALAKDNELINEAHEGDKIEVLISQTPFYAESGGQVADIGIIKTKQGLITISNVQTAGTGKVIHYGQVSEGIITLGTEANASVDPDIRKKIAAHHTTTHLLHAALKKVLGEHVQQSGSLVTPDRLRFDFSHFEGLTNKELNMVEQEVNQQIFNNLPVSIAEMNLEDAKSQGATALFGEKYGEIVRVVSTGEFSTELCGGTHLATTAEAGMFVILSESSIGSGIRRIEAIAGPTVYEQFTSLRYNWSKLAETLKVSSTEVPSRVDALVDANKDLLKQIEQLQQKLASASAQSLTSKVIDINGISVLAQKVEAADMNALRTTADALMEKLSEAVIVVGTIYDDKVGLVAMVSDQLVKQNKLHAGNLIREVAKLCGGGGGGRPTMAQAGGKNPAALPDALDKVPQLVKQQLSN